MFFILLIIFLVILFVILTQRTSHLLSYPPGHCAQKYPGSNFEIYMDACYECPPGFIRNSYVLDPNSPAACIKQPTWGSGEAWISLPAGQVINNSKATLRGRLF